MSTQTIHQLFSKTYIRSVLFLAQLSLKRMYYGSYLGVLWSIIQPAIFITIMSVVMGAIMKFPMEDYALLLMAGLVPWTLFTGSLTQASTSLIVNHGVFKSTRLPKTMFITADILLQVYVFLISFLVMYLVMVLILTEHRPTVLLLPIAALPVIISSFGLGMFFAYVAPYIRDIQHLLGVLFQALFWLTPIVYPIGMLPEKFQQLQQYNPFHILLRPVQKITYYGEIPSVLDMGTAFGLAFATVCLSIYCVKRLRRNVIYYL